MSKQDPFVVVVDGAVVAVVVVNPSVLRYRMFLFGISSTRLK